MRFGLKSKDEQQGNKRVIQKFLFFPLTLEHQTRWMEIVKIRQICNFRQPAHLEGSDVESKYFWDNLEWVDDDDSKKKKTVGVKLVEVSPDENL
jgi:hypothetical protein